MLPQLVAQITQLRTITALMSQHHYTAVDQAALQPGFSYTAVQRFDNDALQLQNAARRSDKETGEENRRPDGARGHDAMTCSSCLIWGRTMG
jgi:hypothetical protein